MLTEDMIYFKEGEIWICKPTGKNQGKGIYIVKSVEEVNKIFENQEERVQEGKPSKPLNRIIQRFAWRVCGSLLCTLQLPLLHDAGTSTSRFC